MLHEVPSIRTVSEEEIDFGAFEFDSSFDLNPDLTDDPPWIQCQPEWVVDRINEQLESELRGNQDSKLEKDDAFQKKLGEASPRTPPVQQTWLDAAERRRVEIGNRLGQENFNRLDTEAKEWLEQCQFLLEKATDMPRPASIVNAVATAFECQLAGVLEKCARKLIAARLVEQSYPADTPRKIVFSGKPQRLKTLGEMGKVLTAMSRHNEVRKHCAGMGFDIAKISSTVEVVRGDRNRSVHEGGLDHANVSTLLLDWLRPQSGIFCVLIPTAQL